MSAGEKRALKDGCSRTGVLGRPIVGPRRTAAEKNGRGSLRGRQLPSLQPLQVLLVRLPGCTPWPCNRSGPTRSRRRGEEVERQWQRAFIVEEDESALELRAAGRLDHHAGKRWRDTRCLDRGHDRGELQQSTRHRITSLPEARHMPCTNGSRACSCDQTGPPRPAARGGLSGKSANPNRGPNRGPNRRIGVRS